MKNNIRVGVFHTEKQKQRTNALEVLKLAKEIEQRKKESYEYNR